MLTLEYILFSMVAMRLIDDVTSLTMGGQWIKASQLIEKVKDIQVRNYIESWLGSKAHYRFSWKNWISE